MITGGLQAEFSVVVAAIMVVLVPSIEMRSVWKVVALAFIVVCDKSVSLSMVTSAVLDASLNVEGLDWVDASLTCITADSLVNATGFNV